jgi:adenine C2-methylase RlmN of 23S rRNA A2503 and tRNA A37
MNSKYLIGIKELGSAALQHGTVDLSSVVFMGMGEPLANLENLHRAVDVLTYSGFSSR